MYIEKLMSPKSRWYKLLETIKIDPNEDLEDSNSVCINGVLRIYHGSYEKMKHKPKNSIVSVFTDYKIIKIYGQEPSEYDQQLYQNVMTAIFENEGYKDNLTKPKRIATRKSTKEELNNEDEEIESE